MTKAGDIITGEETIAAITLPGSQIRWIDTRNGQRGPILVFDPWVTDGWRPVSSTRGGHGDLNVQIDWEVVRVGQKAPARRFRVTLSVETELVIELMATSRRDADAVALAQGCERYPNGEVSVRCADVQSPEGDWDLLDGPSPWWGFLVQPKGG